MYKLILVPALLMGGCVTTPDGMLKEDDEISPEASGYTHYLAGVVQQESMQYEKAIESYRKASDLLPNSVSLHRQLARFYKGIDDYPNTVIMCRRALEKDPNDPGMWVLLAIAEQELGHYDSAASAIERAAQLKPQRDRDYRDLINIAEEANDWTTTIDLTQTLVQVNPESAGFQFSLGNSYLRIGDAESASQAFKKAVEINPAFHEAWRLLGITLLELNQNAEAAHVFDRVLSDPALAQALGPDDRTRLRSLLAGALGRNGQFAAAAEILAVEEKAEAAPDSAEQEPVEELQAPEALDEAGRYLNRVYALIRAGRGSEAASLVPPNGIPILGTVFRAIARRSAGEPYRSLYESLDAVEGELDMETSQYLNTLIYLFGQEEVGNLLTSEFEAARAEGVRSQQLEILTGRVYMLLNRYAEAEPAFLRALEMVENKWPHFYLGLVYDELDRFRDAEKHLKACLALDPNDPEIMNNLAYMYAVQDTKIDEAERLLNRALEMDPNNGFYLDSLGWVYYRKGQPDKAIEYIRRALSALGRDDAILRDHLGDAYLLKGDVARALGEWKRARRLDPKLVGVQEKIDKHGEKAQRRERDPKESREPPAGSRRRISSGTSQTPE